MTETNTSNNDSQNAKTLEKEKNVDIVRELLLKGVKRAEDIQVNMRKAYGVKVKLRTVYKYKALVKQSAIKQVREKEGLDKTIHQIAYEIKEQFELISSSLWKQYHATGSHPKDKIAALREIRNTAEKHVQMLQDLGLVHKAPVQVQTVDKDGNPVDPAGNTQQYAVMFNSFIKQTFQDPQ